MAPALWKWEKTLSYRGKEEEDIRVRLTEVTEKVMELIMK